MAELRTEEEQVQAIKDWWKKNGSSLLIGIGAALAIVFGWQAWQNHQAQQRTEAANQFANLLNAFSDQADETSGETVAFVAQTLREDYTDSAYAVYGNLILARQQLMQEGNAEAAIDSLKWALEKTGEHEALALVVRNRLARAQFSSGQYEDALATINLLALEPRALSHLITAYQAPSYDLRVASRFEAKDQLKSMGCKWDAENKQWHKLVSGDDDVINEAIAELKTADMPGLISVSPELISPVTRYANA